jgi:hypothetical protein
MQVRGKQIIQGRLSPPPGDRATTEMLQVWDISIRPPDPRAITEFSSMNDEWLNGAQRVSKVEHQESSMSLRSREWRIYMTSRAGHVNWQRGGWCAWANWQGWCLLFHFSRIIILPLLLLVLIKWPDLVSNRCEELSTPRTGKQMFLCAQALSKALGTQEMRQMWSLLLGSFPSGQYLRCHQCLVRMKNVLRYPKK